MSVGDLRVRFELVGWSLFGADLERQAGGEGRLERLRRQVVDEVRDRYELRSLAAHPTIAALRALFKAAGCDPSRYRPSSEALVRRLLKGAEMPAISPLVDLNNCLSALLAVPCCVMAEGTFGPPYEFRSGRSGESYESLRGPFKLDRKPLLCDAHGPCDAPISGSQRVKVTPATERASLVAYLPAGVVEPETVRRELERLVAAAPVARILATVTAPPRD